MQRKYSLRLCSSYGEGVGDYLITTKLRNQDQIPDFQHCGCDTHPQAGEIVFVSGANFFNQAMNAKSFEQSCHLPGSQGIHRIVNGLWRKVSKDANTLNSLRY